MSSNLIYSNILSRCEETLLIWNELIKSNLEDDEKTSYVNSLKDCTKKICTLDLEHQRNVNAFKQVENFLNNDNNYDADENIDETIDKLYKESLEKNNINKNFKDHSIWMNVFGDDVEEIELSNSQNSTRFEQLDDSVACSIAVFKPPVDPISKIIIRDPYRNKKCKHVYEKCYIYEYVRNMSTKAKCPYIGCKNNKLALSQLVADAQLKTQIEEYVSNHGESSNMN